MISDEKFAALDEKIDRILIQTTKTNGRVDAVEARTDKQDDQLEKLWDRSDSARTFAARVSGIFAVLGCLGAALISKHFS